VKFTVTPVQLSLVAENGESYQPAGKLFLSVGGGQPGVKIAATSNVLTKQLQVL